MGHCTLAAVFPLCAFYMSGNPVLYKGAGLPGVGLDRSRRGERDGRGVRGAVIEGKWYMKINSFVDIDLLRGTFHLFILILSLTIVMNQWSCLKLVRIFRRKVRCWTTTSPSRSLATAASSHSRWCSTTTCHHSPRFRDVNHNHIKCNM